MSEIRRLTPPVGIAAVVVTFGAIGLAILASPSFSLTTDALSNLGDAGDPAGTPTTELLFNGGLILGGLAGAAFAAGLLLLAAHPVQRLGAVVFGVSMLSMGGVGVFPQDGPFHFQVAVGFYMLFSAGVIGYGAGQVLDGRRREGALSLVPAVGNLGVWILWGATGAVTRPGLAMPELAGAVLVAAWTALTARRLAT